jgi:predicted transcriptional regulator with HTH domain
MKGTEGTELSEYIRGVVDAIKEGMKGTGFVVNGEIKLELAVVNTKKEKEGFKVFVVNAKGNKAEELSKIKFSIKEDEAVAGVLMPSD